MAKATLQGRLDGLEEALARIRSVVSGRAGYGPDGSLAEISVVARAERSAGQIVRDVVALLGSRFGLEVSEKIVRLALIYGDSRPDLGDGRLSLDRLTVRSEAGRQQVAVQVGYAGGSFWGWAAAPPGRRRTVDLVGTATLRAVEAYLGTSGQFRFERIVEVPLDDRKAIVSSLSLASGGGEVYLTGIAAVDELSEEAAARSTLDAINRRLRFTDKPKEVAVRRRRGGLPSGASRTS